MNKKIIGILGGMGPEASAYLYRLMVDMAAKEFGARENADFPEIILYSVPVPDFISSGKEKDIALEMLQDRIKKLQAFEISHLAVACNTAHILLPELQVVSQTPFISMIDEVIYQIVQSKKKKVALLGTPMTIRSKLYQKALRQHGIIPIVPSAKQLTVLEQIIRCIIAGNVSEQDKRNVIDITRSLEKKGAEGVILGCTELPIIFPKRYPLPSFNSVEILARSLLKQAYETYEKKEVRSSDTRNRIFLY